MFRCREVLDNTVSMIKNAMSGCLVDRDRIAVGTEEALFCVDLDRDEICRIGDQKKIHQVRRDTIKGSNTWAANLISLPTYPREGLVIRIGPCRAVE